MPNFGDYETVGEPLAVLNLQDRSLAVWKARKAGAPDNREFIVKSYTPHHKAQEGDAGDALDRDRSLEFLEGVKQLKKAHDEDPRCLVPVHDLGITPHGAWYASDFYPRGSLMGLIGKKVKVDSAALRQIVGSIAAACLALQKSRGVSHGNLKASNVFLAGKPGPLPKTQIVLADPVPALLQMARLDSEERHAVDELLHQTAEVQDLRALGEIILQLVERRIIRSGYCDPPQRSELWDGLGKDGERWRQLCVQLLDPKLSLAEINLASLAKKFSARAAVHISGKAVLAAAAVVGVCLVAGAIIGLLRTSHAHVFAAAMDSAREDLNAAQQETQGVTDSSVTHLVAARADAAKAVKLRPQDQSATQLQNEIEQESARRFAWLMSAATNDTGQSRFESAEQRLNLALSLKPGAAEAENYLGRVKTSKTMAEMSLAIVEGSKLLDQGSYLDAQKEYGHAGELAKALGDATSQAEAEAGQRCANDLVRADAATTLDDKITWLDTALQHKKNVQGLKERLDAAKKLRDEGNSMAAAEAAAQRQKAYKDAMESGRASFAAGDYAGAMAQAETALNAQPNDAAALRLKGEIVARQQRQRTYDDAMRSGQARLAEGNYADALAQVEKALSAETNDAAALRLKGEIVARQQRQKTYDDAMQGGRTKLAAGDYAAALTQAQAALNAVPNDPAALQLKSEIVARQQAEALRIQNYAAAMLAATNAWSRAESQYGQGRFDEALTNLQSALDQCVTAVKYGQGGQLASANQLEAALNIRQREMNAGKTQKLEQLRNYAAAMNAATNAWRQASADFDKHDYSAALANSQTALDQCSTARKYGQGPEPGQLEYQLQLFQAAVYFDQGQYDQAAALCTAHQDDPSFKNLAKTISLESNQLAQATAQFNNGDYSFVADWQKNGHPQKSRFEDLLANAKPEADVFNQLKSLTGDTVNWAKVNVIVTSSSNAKFINKNGFTPFRSWWSRNDPIRQLEAKLAAFEVFTGIRNPTSTIVNPYMNGNVPAAKLPPGTQLDWYYARLDELKTAYQKQGGDQSKPLARIKKVENALNTM